VRDRCCRRIPFGLGTDSGGSLRLPAAWCGLATLKPTAQLVPVSDLRTQAGPIARSVRDLELALRIVAGPDGRDGGVPPVSVGSVEAVAIRGLRVGVRSDNGLEPGPETA